VCALFNITRTTVHDWAQAGKLRKVKVRSRVYFLASEIRKMLE
jgi:predicted site-specific integrase-resolvase